MGIPSIEGYINDDKDLWFDASISTTENFEDKFSRSGELGKLIKDPENPYPKLKRKRKKRKRIVSALFLSIPFKKNVMVSFL